MSENRLSSGISGLDEVLSGGYVSDRTYLIRGGPGAGKTTLGMHFLTTGVTNGEQVLFITLGETVTQLRRTAEVLGFDLQGVTFLDLSPTPEFFAQVQTYDIFSPAEVEREPTTRRIVDRVEALKPQRIFIDSMTQFRYLASDTFQFRKQVLSFLRFLVEQSTTVLFTSESSEEAPDDDLQFMSDGVINLDFRHNERTLCISKFRGSDFQDGHHAIRLTSTGMQLFPRLMLQDYGQDFNTEVVSSGIPEIDELLHGGIERSTITIISGPSGVGKSTLGLQFMKEAAGRGEHSVIYTFEERKETLLRRAEGINIAVSAMQEKGTLSVVQVEPLYYTPDEFANLVRQEVEQQKAQIVMIDSVSGYRLSVRGKDLISHLHALCKYLQNMGVAVLLINEIEMITGDFRVTEIGISYLADTIIFLRYLEMQGELRRTIGVLKKRMTDFEKTLREFEISRYGLKVGKPLTQLRGVLTGVPEMLGDEL
ncbi:AAA family ATPase [Nostocaceae cyanobacterium CENA369]|uniref:non-specific serine/threonine protein kinase n=1 Tax=Dendronalium phyllosphericum CENA369 TaxID=1725256 RepID=A0A8J7I310_9NOST|nr:gas vesicle protein GvpD [Dendronalium phyllosphericum]MBH8571467.1 AAA family ATPase [Dendronalium phyllosphericum CENA369]